MFKSILSKYENFDTSIQFRAKAMLSAVTVYIALFVVAVAINALERDMVPLIAELIILVILFLILKLIHAGRYHFAASILMYVAILVPIPLTYGSPFTTLDEGYLTVVYLVPSLMSLTLFGTSIRQVVVSMIGGELVILASLVFRAIPSGMESTSGTVIHYAPAFLVHLVAAAFSAVIIRSNLGTLEIIAESERRTSSRLAEMDSLVENLRIKMNVGERLETMSAASLGTAEGIARNTEQLNAIMGELAEKMDRAENDQKAMAVAGREMGHELSVQSEAIRTSSAGIEQIASSVSQITESMKERNRALAGLTRDSRKSEGMLKVADESFDKLRTSNDKINEISQVIEDVGDRTNLLAMNASIEAAHAGEVGRGFAVVAGEIRKLAEATNAQSRLIQDLLKDGETVSEEVMDNSRGVMGTFVSIIEQLERQSRSMSEAGDGMDELARGAAEINVSVANLRKTNASVNNSVDTVSGKIDGSLENIRSVSDLTSRAAELMNLIAGASETLLASSRDLSEIGRTNAENIRSLEDSLAEIR